MSSTIVYENDFNKDVPGVYSFHYYVTDSLNRQGHAVLTVVVEDNDGE